MPSEFRLININTT